VVRRLLLLAGLAAICVVIHHATTWIVTAIVWWADKYAPVQVPDQSWLGTGRYYGVRILDQLVFFPVPAFLFVSGYFVSMAAGRADDRTRWKILLNRCLWLAVPYLIWSIIILGMRRLDGAVFGVEEVLRKLLNGGATGPFYYVPMLIGLYLLSFWLVPVVRFRPAAALGISMVIAAVVILLRYPLILHPGEPILPRPLQLLSNWNLPKYAPWFIGGILAESYLDRFRSELHRWRRHIFFGVLLLGALGFAESEILRMASGRDWLPADVTMLNMFFALLLLLSLLAIEIPESALTARLRTLGTMSFGIYLMHVLVLEVTARGLVHLAPRLLGATAFLYILLATAGVAIPVATMYVVKHSPLRGAYRFLFG